MAPDAAPQTKRLGESRCSTAGDAGRGGVRYLGGVSVDALDAGVVHLDNGVSVDADVILAATGVSPRS